MKKDVPAEGISCRAGSAKLPPLTWASSPPTFDNLCMPGSPRSYTVAIVVLNSRDLARKNANHLA